MALSRSNAMAARSFPAPKFSSIASRGRPHGQTQALLRPFRRDPTKQEHTHTEAQDEAKRGNRAARTEWEPGGLELHKAITNAVALGQESLNLVNEPP